MTNFRLIPLSLLILFTGMAAPAIATAQTATVTIDGNLNDWTDQDVMNPAPWENASGFKIYGKKVGADYAIAIQSSQTAIGTYTTIWLNTDGDAQTGQQIFGWAGGAEYNVNIYTDSAPYLYTGDAGENYVTGPLQYAYNAQKTVLEILIPGSLIGNPASVSTLLDINNDTFLPANYASTPYTIGDTIWPKRTDLNRRVGIVYSTTTAEHFFSKKAYSQLYMAMQHQAMMAGVPFDLLSEEDMRHLDKIINYDALIIPSFADVPAATRDEIATNLFNAVHRYHVGLLTSGDFLTNDETGTAFSGDAYNEMKMVTGLAPDLAAGPVSVDVKAVSALHPITARYKAGESVMTLDNAWIKSFAPTDLGIYESIADQTAGGTTSSAMLASMVGARIVHFGTEQIMADSPLAWSAIEWLVFGNNPALGLKLGRGPNLFVSRTDMDQSQYLSDFKTVLKPFHTLMKKWNNEYDFVGTFFINIGNDPKNGSTTNWAKSGPIYQDLMKLGNEIGDHSWTHPENTNLLTPAQLEYEFNQSRLEISKQLGVNVVGAAIPGAPEGMPVDVQLNPYFEYLTGEYANTDSGYRTAVGFMTPDFDMLYQSPNLYFDFSMIEFWKWDAVKSGQTWLNQYADIMKHASQPVIDWPWHDYAVTSAIGTTGYSLAMFENLLKKAAADGSEFLTSQDLTERISSLIQADFSVTPLSATVVSATVAGSGFGKFSLKNDSNLPIKSVDNWYAYNGSQVFLPDAGGSYTIRLGTTPDVVTHITSLPMRSRLLSVGGNGTNLSFTFNGEGKVQIAVNIPKGKKPSVTGADNSSLSKTTLTLHFRTPGNHTASIVMK